MALKTTPVFIPILPDPNPSWSVKITHSRTATDVTSRVLKGEFVRRILRLGVGQFKLELNNTGATYSESFSGGDDVKFCADFSDGTTQLFWGRIDFIKESISNGQVLEINGRHRSYLLSEKIGRAHV